MKIITLEVGFHVVSQTEEVMYCREEKSCGGELVTQIFMILGYFNLVFSVVANSLATMNKHCNITSIP